jgi:hypothetical protein
MRTRSKLNLVHAVSCVLLSAVFGVVFRSWLVFKIFLIAGTRLALSSGAIRL